MSTLSVCIPGATPRWMRAIAELIRPAASEIVVAVDSRTSEDAIGQLETVVDQLFRVEYADPPDRVLAWLYEQCSCEWILRLDNDEVPSPELVAALPRLIEEDALTHYWFCRRWLYPTVTQYLDEPPWSPNRDPRLVRNDPRFLRIPGVVHGALLPEGPSAWLDLPIYHFDLIVNDAAARRQKAERYEQMRPGVRDRRSINEAFYLPESRPQARLAPVPPEHVAHIRSVINAPDIAGRPSHVIAIAARNEIDALWPARPLPETAYRASVELSLPVEPITAGERKVIEARVRNEGTEHWPWGTATPKINLSYHWLDAHGHGATFDELRTALPHALEPGAALVMPLTIDAPATPGAYTFQAELVHEGRRWFGDGPRVQVTVTPARRLAILVHGDGGDALAERLLVLSFERPEHEVVLIGSEPATLAARFGRSAVEGPREYLIGTRRSRGGALARATRLMLRIDRPEFAQTLASSELLLVEGEPRDRIDRLAERVARSLG